LDACSLITLSGNSAPALHGSNSLPRAVQKGYKFPSWCDCLHVLAVLRAALCLTWQELLLLVPRWSCSPQPARVDLVSGCGLSALLDIRFWTQSQSTVTGRSSMCKWLEAILTTTFKIASLPGPRLNVLHFCSASVFAFAEALE